MVLSKPCIPCHAPSIAPAIAAMVSVSPPIEAAKHKACVGSSKKARRNGESGGHGLVRFHAGTAIPLQHSSEFVVIEPASISFGPIHEILHTRKHRSLCRPIATLWKLPYEFHREVQKVTFSFNGKAHRRSHQSGRFNALHRVMRHHTGSPGASASAWPGRNAMPTGVARIAPPLVVPNRPVSSRLTPR